jgi:hypothetical protein
MLLNSGGLPWVLKRLPNRVFEADADREASPATSNALHSRRSGRLNSHRKVTVMTVTFLGVASQHEFRRTSLGAQAPARQEQVEQQVVEVVPIARASNASRPRLVANGDRHDYHHAWRGEPT